MKFLKPKAVIDYLDENFTVRQAIEKMRHHGFTAVPVVDKDGNYVKTLAEGDILWFLIDNKISDVKALEDYSVRDIPKRVNCEPVDISSSVTDLILLSLNQNFVPVIDDRKKFIGIVTRSDILRYCHDALNGSIEYNKEDLLIKGEKGEYKYEE